MSYADSLSSGGGGGVSAPTQYTNASASGAVTISMANGSTAAGSNQWQKLTGNVTFTLPAVASYAGYTLSLLISQPASTATVTFSPVPTGTLPTYSAGRYLMDRVELYSNGVDWIVLESETGLVDSSAPWIPTIVSGLTLWLKADDAANLTVDGSNNVSQWNDLSGNANHFTQSTAGNRPPYATNQLNGKAGVQFTAGKGLVGPSTVFFASGNPGTWAYVVKPTSAFTGGNDAVLTHFNSAGTGSLIEWFGDKIGFVYGSSEFLAPSWPTGTNVGNSAIFTYNGSGASTVGNYACYVGGSTQVLSSTSNGSSTVANAVLGANDSSGNYAALATICEVVFYDTVLSGADRTALLNYLHTQWGV